MTKLPCGENIGLVWFSTKFSKIVGFEVQNIRIILLWIRANFHHSPDYI